VSYNLPQNTEDAIIEIYNVKGQLVRQIAAAERGTSWDCHDTNNNLVSSGVYFYRLSGTGIESRTEKMILLR
jgi:flagellar hook assembly protein FlgD